MDWRLLLDEHRASSWSNFLRSALLLFSSNLPPWYSTFLTLHKPVFTLWPNLLQTIIQSIHWTEQQKRLSKETMVLWVPFLSKLLFSTSYQHQGWQLLCDIIPSKILHNLKSVAIENLLSRFCNPIFNQFLYILKILRDILVLQWQGRLSSVLNL